MPDRWRSLSGSLIDPEKQGLCSHPDVDDFDSASSLTPSSRNSSGSYAAMLREDFSPSAFSTKRFWSYQIPRKRFTRYFTLAISTSLILFIFFLIKASWISQAEVEAGLINIPKPAPEWEAFTVLHKYYSGIRTLVDRAANEVEYPVSEDVEAKRLEEIAMQRKITEEMRASAGSQKRDEDWKNRAVDFNPFQTADLLESGMPVPCLLDATRNMSAPKLLAYKGIPHGFPNAVLGSNELLGIENDLCFDRYGRYGPYGYGYSKVFGGSDAGLEGDTDGKDLVWADDAEVDYRTIKWAEIQESCMQANSHRFVPSKARDQRPHWLMLSGKKPPTPPINAKRDDIERRTPPLEPHLAPASALPPQPTLLPGELSDMQISEGKRYLPRTAFIIRTWHDYVYDDEDLFNLRAIVNELSIQSGGEYTVHFLVHVRNSTLQIWADESIYQQVLDDALPQEFRGMGTLWSEQQMALIYGGLDETMFRDLAVHGVYRSSYMPLQFFAHMHPRYDFYWNWEMDVRYTGHFYHLLDKASKWAREQPRKGLWERNGRFFVPAKHGSYEDFRQMVRVQMEHGTASKSNMYSKMFSDTDHAQVQEETQFEKPVWGPRVSDDSNNDFDTSHDPSPPTSYEKDNYSWGVGEAADLITFSPIFDPVNSGWLLTDDVTGYNKTAGSPPRRASIGTATRLSRRLLTSMHHETAVYRRTMFSEQWPATCALHHGLKAVFVPHPVYIDRAWPTSYLAAVFNNGHNGATGGARTSIFNEDRRHNLKGVTWYYDSVFGSKLYRRWLGFKVENEGGEEFEVNGEGRMCLPPMLLHPVKEVDLIVDGRGEEVDKPPPDEDVPVLYTEEGIPVDPEIAALESALLKDD